MAFENLRNRIAIAGIGYTPQGKVEGRTAVSFHIEAVKNAIEDAGIGKEEVDALLLYRHFDAIGGDYDVTAFTVAEQLGIRPQILSQETYCTRSWLLYSIGLLESGICKYIVLSYGDNARSARRSFVKEVKEGKAVDELAAYGDLSTMAKYAMLARRAQHIFGTGPDVWKEIAIAQRRWAELNPIAAMRHKPLNEDGYYGADIVAEPLRLMDATPNSDGGRAIVLTTAERAKERNLHPLVTIRGFGSANQPLSPFRLCAEDTDSAAARAGRQAFEMAGITKEDIDACELYDCFTYTVEATLRDYGFFQAGEEKEFLRKERLGPGGEFPVNTSGGMLSEAYFMGLTPVSEGVMQLMGRCGARQLGVHPGTKYPRFIMCSDNGGVFQSHASLILERME